MKQPLQEHAGNQGPCVGLDDVRAAHRRIEGVAHRTPVTTCSTISVTSKAAALWFKCENFQRVGAFKFRGAFHALSRLSEAQRRAGVLTYSSGNHAQAIALAGRLLNIPTFIVMPRDAPSVKLQATRGYLGPGSEVVLYDRSETSREQLGQQLASERKLTIVPPYDHPDIIAGQGTAALELFEDVGALDLLLVPVGGGGLLSGSAVVAKALHPACRVIGVEPAEADDAARSFRSGTLCTVHDPQTIADGARTPSLGRFTFPIVMQLVDEILTVSEDEIRQALRLVIERAKLFIEPTAALGVAGLLRLSMQHAQSTEKMRIGVILSGGNCDLDSISMLVGGSD